MQICTDFPQLFFQIVLQCHNLLESPWPIVWQPRGPVVLWPLLDFSGLSVRQAHVVFVMVASSQMYHRVNLVLVSLPKIKVNNIAIFDQKFRSNISRRKFIFLGLAFRLEFRSFRKDWNFCKQSKFREKSRSWFVKNQDFCEKSESLRKIKILI